MNSLSLSRSLTFKETNANTLAPLLLEEDRIVENARKREREREKRRNKVCVCEFEKEVNKINNKMKKNLMIYFQ